MDTSQFDRLATTLATTATRRGVTRLLLGMPLVTGLAAQLSNNLEATAKDDDHGSSHRHQRRKARHRHQTGNDKDHRKGQRKGKRKGGKRCQPESPAQTCAGKCGTVQNSCGQPVACNPCTCATGCPQCQICNPVTLLCENVTDGTGCDNGNPCTENDTCQSGVCTAGPNAPNRTVCAGSGTDTSVCCSGTCWNGCCGDGGAPGPCRVFVTDNPLFNGNLGGLSGADELCRQRAQLGGLPGADLVDNYKAWLSNSTASPETRFRHSQQPYILPKHFSTGGEEQVANGWSDLTTCDGGGFCLDHAIDLTETGRRLTSPDAVWTHTRTDGTAEVGANHCNNWASSSSADGGDFGDAGVRDALWTDWHSLTCNSQQGRLYCFQQR